MSRPRQRRIALLGVAALVWGGVAVVGSSPLRALPASPVEVRIGDVSVAEGNGTAITKVTMSVVLSGETTTPLCIEYTIGAPATATGVTGTGPRDGSRDFLVKHGFRLVPAGKSLVTVPTAVLGDDVVEGDEAFSVHVDSVRAPATSKCLPTDPVAPDRVARPTGTVTILEDDPVGPLTLRLGSVAVPERDTTIVSNAVVPMTLSAPSPATGVCVEWSTPPTQPDTASWQGDYRSRGQKFEKIPAGKTSTKASVKVYGDNTTEGDEMFSVVVGGVTLPNGSGKCGPGGVDAGVNVVGSPSKVKILDDDGPGAPRDLVVSFQSPDTVVLSWSPPGFEGGAPVSGYFVQQWDGVQSIPIVTTTDLSVSHSCGAGNTCLYIVMAINSHGYGLLADTGEVVCC